MLTLHVHRHRLSNGDLTLRPMTEDDWEPLYRWNNDPEVLYYAEGDDISGRSLEDVQAIYRGVSQSAFNFMVEYSGMVIGECWLQRVNLERLLERFPHLDCRRIDLAIGEKAFWGRAIGTEVIRLLTRFGFEEDHADAIFGCSIADYNPRSRRAFEKNGYVVVQENVEPEGMKAKLTVDLMLTRERYEENARCR